MRLIVGVLLGLFSGLLIGFMLAPTPSSMSPEEVSSRQMLMMVGIFGGWVASTFYMVRSARSVAAVVSRGSLLGAGEWLLMAVGSLIFVGRTAADVMEKTGGDAARQAGAMIGGGVATFIGTGFSLLMAGLCAVVFLLAFFMDRAQAHEATGPTRPCPECAEMIQREAKKCHHCGAQVTPA